MAVPKARGTRPWRPGRTVRYQIAAGVAHREVDGTLLLLAPADGALLTLNASGELIWRRLAQGAATADTLSALVARDFGIPAARAAADVTAFLERLRAGAFVVEV